MKSAIMEAAGIKHPNREIYWSVGHATTGNGVVRETFNHVMPDHSVIEVSCLVNSTLCSIVATSLVQHQQLNG